MHIFKKQNERIEEMRKDVQELTERVKRELEKPPAPPAPKPQPKPKPAQQFGPIIHEL